MALRLKMLTNQENLFKVMNLILNRKVDSPFPCHDSDQELADDFGHFFVEKISNIDQKVNQAVCYLTETRPISESRMFHTKLSCFTPLLTRDVCQLMKEAPNKSCQLDPLPTWLL